VQPNPGAVIAFRQLDLTGVERIGVAAQAQGGRNAEVGGQIEIRRGSPTGALLGTAQVTVAAGRGGAPAAPTPAAAVTTQPLGGPLDSAAGRGGAAPAPAGREGGAGAAGGRGVVAAPPAAAGGGRGGAVAPVVRVSVPVAPSDGVHDLYVVFRNDTARPTDLLMTVTDLRLFFRP
jgi:cytochrome c